MGLLLLNVAIGVPSELGRHSGPEEDLFGAEAQALRSTSADVQDMSVGHIEREIMNRAKPAHRAARASLWFFGGVSGQHRNWRRPNQLFCHATENGSLEAAPAMSTEY